MPTPPATPWAGTRLWDVPARLAGLPGARRALVRIGRADSLERRLQTGSLYEVTVGLRADLSSLPSLFEGPRPPGLVAGLTRIEVSGTTEGDPTPYLKNLVSLAACLDFDAGPKALEQLQRCSEAGVMCRLHPLEGWVKYPAALRDSLEHYLTSPRLEVPVEPWDSIARSVASRRPRDLWAVYDESLRRNYWLDDEQRVSLSERTAREGRFFGHLDEGPQVWECSALWQDLLGRRRRLFLERRPCAFCQHFLWCGAYGATGTGEPDPAWCLLWMPLFERICAAAETALAAAAEVPPTDYPG